MKKTIFIFLCLLCAIAMRAAKANSIPVTVTQPDGTLLTVVLHGDEHANWYTTTDGTLLVQQSSAYYVARVQNNGSLASTGLLAHKAELRQPAELQAIAAQDKAKFLRMASSRARRLSIDTDATKRYFPHTGSPRALVLLVEFSDTTFSLADPQASFAQYLNGEGELVDLGANEHKNYGSARQYFSEMSFGAFTPQFDIYGPFKLSGTSATYGAGTNDRMDLFIPDACAAADSKVDFSQYDADGDGYVDLVYIIYAGYSANYSDNPTEYIWPKSGTISGGTYDGVKVWRYGINNELIAGPTTFSTSNVKKRINGLGLFVHEFSHTMGLPDLYATTDEAAYLDNQGMEYWSVMDGGENNNNGYYPTAYTAWEREVLGWFAADTLTDTCSVASLAPIDKGGKAYKVVNPGTEEYVMLENVQQDGWNAKLKGHGLLTYRINYGNAAVNTNDRPNNTAGKPRVVVLAADGLLKNIYNCKTAQEYYEHMAGDTYPGTSGVTEIESFTMLDGTQLERPLLNIAEADSLIAFDYLGKKEIVNAITAPTISHNPAAAIYTLDGRFVGTDPDRLHKGVYVTGGKKFVK